MKLLVDTSVILRTSQPDSPEFEPAVKAITQLRSQGFNGCMVPQIIYEYWAVATRPIEVNGLLRSERMRGPLTPAPRPSTLAASMTARVQRVFQNPGRYFNCVSMIINCEIAQPLAASEPKPSTSCDRESGSLAG